VSGAIPDPGYLKNNMLIISLLIISMIGWLIITDQDDYLS
jgi:hypothetical protein